MLGFARGIVNKYLNQTKQNQIKPNRTKLNLTIPNRGNHILIANKDLNTIVHQ